VPFCKSPKASFICLVQQLEAPEFPREISAFITSRKVLLFESTILFQNLTADLNSKIARVPARILEEHTSLQE
jgi:hypothetical protein